MYDTMEDGLGSIRRILYSSLGEYSESSPVDLFSNEMYLLEVEMIDMQLFDEMMGYKCQQLQMEQSGYILEEKEYIGSEINSDGISSYSYDKDKDKWSKTTTGFIKQKGFFTKVWDAVKKVIAWFVKTMKTIWYTIIGFFSKIIAKIKFFFSSVKNYKPTSEDLTFKVSWVNFDTIKKMYDEFMKMKTLEEVSGDELDYLTSTTHGPTFADSSGKEIGTEEIRSEAAKNKKEIGKVAQLSSPKAVMEVTIQLKDIIRRLESRSKTIINSAERFEKMFKPDSENTDKPKSIYPLIKIITTSTVKGCNALLECFKINLKAATSTMAHFVECQKKSKKSSESKSESFLFDYDYEW